MKKYINYITFITLSVSLISAQDNTVPEMSEEYIAARNEALTSTFTASSTVIVDQFGGGDYTTIQDALNDTGDGTVIQVNAGLYYENVYFPYYLTFFFNGYCV